MKECKNKVYLSGGFRSNWQTKVIEPFENDFVFFNPREHNLLNSNDYTAWDIHHVRKCDIFFAYMENTNPSGFGLAFELGLAYAENKTIILIDEKSNLDASFGKYFKILHKPSSVVFSTLTEGIEFLKTFR